MCFLLFTVWPWNEDMNENHLRVTAVEQLKQSSALNYANIHNVFIIFMQ